MWKKEIERRPLLAAGAAAGLSAVLPSLSIAQTRPDGSGTVADDRATMMWSFSHASHQSMVP
jgi:hypothetical protein